jgi:VIT1/CCC1 family predicted Fe2+/Mn2+ transporter
MRRKKYFPDIIFGGIDGIVTTFAIVSGVVGAALSPFIVFILGIASLFADGVSMGVSNYLSTKTENQIKKDINKNPIGSGIATFFAFIIFGAIPLIPYVVFQFSSFDFGVFTVSSILTVFTFILLGYLKTKIVGTNMIKTIFETLIIGIVAALIAYFIGDFLSGLIY